MLLQWNLSDTSNKGKKNLRTNFKVPLSIILIDFWPPKSQGLPTCQRFHGICILLHYTQLSFPCWWPLPNTIDNLYPIEWLSYQPTNQVFANCTHTPRQLLLCIQLSSSVPRDFSRSPAQCGLDWSDVLGLAWSPSSHLSCSTMSQRGLQILPCPLECAWVSESKDFGSNEWFWFQNEKTA